MEKYVIKQMVRTVKNCWLEVVFTTTVERVARQSFAELVEENPNEYFELSKIFTEEECLIFTAKNEVKP